MNARFTLGTDDFKLGNITFELDIDYQRIVVLTIASDHETYRL